MNWNKPLYVDARSDARRQMELWRHDRPDDAALMARVAKEPQAIWLTQAEALRAVAAHLPSIRKQNAVAVFVCYYLPYRDEIRMTGGASSAEEYRGWVAKLAQMVRTIDAIVVLEPDALAQVERLPEAEAKDRLQLLGDAVREFASPRTAVYIDAGNPRWHSPKEMAARLMRANVAEATGFALNVANSIGLEENVVYGHRFLQLLPGKHFVIDTSRNGSGPLLRSDGSVEWCNPPGRSLGRPPTLETMLEYVDALLWLKPPGSSDGECKDGPPAGVWWPDYALDLARRTK